MRRYSAEELEELDETRILLEGFVARKAAERHTSLDAARVRAAHERMSAVGADASPEQRVTANRGFHLAVWRAARNRSVLEVLARLHQQEDEPF